MLYYISLLFKVIDGGLAIIFVAEIIRRFFINRIVKSILALNDERKSKLSQADSTILSVYKILFWLTPIYLLVIPAIVYFFIPEVFSSLTLAMILMYVVVFEDFLYRRTVWKSIGRMESETK